MQPIARAVRLIAVLLGSWGLGAALCLLKGDAGGLVDVLGNLSAPYGITAVLAGLLTRCWWSGALLGIVATELTLGGFYWGYGSLLGHEVSVATLTFWGLLGLPLGAACGLLGRAAVRRPALRYSIPAMLILEPLALRMEVITSRFGFGYADLTPDDLTAFAIEIATGVLVALLVRASLLARRRAA